MKCSECKFAFPNELVNPVVVNSMKKNVCGVCALNIIRKAHANPNYQFSDGGRAKDIYDATVQYRMDHQS
jgi:hypothetical protein